MAFANSYTTLDAIPEAFRPHYKKQADGTFAIDVEGQEDLGGLRAVNFDLKEKNKKLKEKVKAFGDLTPEQLEELQEKAERGDASESEVVKGLNKKVKDLEKDLAKSTGTVETAVKELRVVKLEAEVEKEITAAKGNVALLKPHVLKSADMVEEDGTFTTVVKGDDGKIDPKRTLKDVVAALKADKEFSTAFIGSGVSGTGSHPSSGTGNGAGTTSDEAKPSDESVGAKMATGQYSF